MKTKVNKLENKRKAFELSPNQPENTKVSKMCDDPVDNRKVGDMTVDDLKKVIVDVTNQTIKNICEQVQLLVLDVEKLRKDNQDLRKEVQNLRDESDYRRKSVLVLEDQVKRKNIIVKGLPSNNGSPKEEFLKLCSNTMKLDNQSVHVRSVKKIYDRNNKMGIVAELNSEEEVLEVLKNSRKLAGSQISIERDLNSEKQLQKKVMLQLKKDIMEINTSQRVTVRDERMRIGDKWFSWNRGKQFMSGKMDGCQILNQLYGNNLKISLNYFDIFEKLNNYGYSM